MNVFPVLAHFHLMLSLDVTTLLYRFNRSDRGIPVNGVDYETLEHPQLTDSQKLVAEDIVLENVQLCHYFT